MIDPALAGNGKETHGMLRGLGDLKDMGAMLKKVMDLKNEMESIKEKLGNEIVEGESGAGMVRVIMNGKMEVLEVKFDPTLVGPEQLDILPTMVKGAVNDALRKAQQLVKDRMSEIAGGLNIPGLMG